MFNMIKSKGSNKLFDLTRETRLSVRYPPDQRIRYSPPSARPEDKIQSAIRQTRRQDTVRYPPDKKTRYSPLSARQEDKIQSAIRQTTK